MKKTYSVIQRLLALVLSIVLVAAYIPTIATPTKAASSTGSATVDPHTLDQWKEFFGVKAPNANNVSLTTEYAGGVWTDKSVFDFDSIPSQLTNAKYNGNSFSVNDKGDNFLVSLSAIASNKQIKGFSTIPTDTVFVLDLSSSMRYTDDSGNSAVDELVDATNQAITDLLELNKNNRVAVVIYAGNSRNDFSDDQGKTQILLPLDSYTTNKTTNGVGTYLQIDPLTVLNYRGQSVPNTNPYGLAVYDGVTGTSGNTAFRNNSFEVSTGTYMQDGIYEAMKVLLNAEPVVQEGVQVGTNRMPIMVLMTDGEPTLANPDYDGNDARTDLGTSTMYNYGGTTSNYGNRDMIAFVTSLTAAFAKKEIAAHYNMEPLLYTLAYGSTVVSRPEARSILDPASASSTQNTLWNSFLNGNTIQVYSYFQNNRTQYYTVRNAASGTAQLTVNDRLYVNKYFPASNDDQMLAAFESIVNEIILQSKYYPTYVEKDVNHDGYLTFVDKIGEYMEVSEIKGIVVGNRLFSGAALASKFNAGDLGSVDNPTALGDNFVWSVKERLGISDASVARALLASAFNNKQICYTSDTDFDHYIGWYSDAQGNYIDAWHEGMTAQQIPAGATHIMKSYGFLGDTTVVPGVSNTDMMYMTVRIAKEIATGEEIVTWQIPAALVPTVTYEVDVQVDSDGNITDLIDLKLESNTADSPIRLLYEVELRDDIYDWNLTEKVDPNYTTYKDPGYVFYTNKWNTSANDTTRNTYSHFEPSVQNERYYYTQDTLVYADEQGTVYEGTKPSGSGYYHSLQVFEKLTNGTYRIHTHTEPISTQAMETVEPVAGTNRWVIPKDTVHRYYDYEIAEKTQNATDTMPYSDHPFVVKTGQHYYTYSTQGNNGKLVLTPATGLKLTKTLAEGYANNGSFTFVIGGDIANAQVVRLTEAGMEKSRTALPANGQVELTAGETVYIVGLTATAYTVSESIPTGAGYKVAAVKVNGQSVSGEVANVTLTAQTITGVEFTNDARTYGNLIVSKDVMHPFDVVPDAITSKQFTIHVDLDGENVANATFAATGLAGVTSITTDAEGKFTVQLRDGEAITVQSLPEGTTYTTTETLTAADAGYSLYDAISTLTGTIKAETPAQAHVVNRYTPAPATETLTINGTKTVDSQLVTFDWTNKSFSFKLESYDPATATYTQVGNLASVTTDGGSYSFGPLTFDTLGTYYYKVSEVIPEDTDRMDGMSYDATVGRLVVHVTDHDVDGQLEVDVRDYTTNQSLTASGNAFTFTKNFVNVYTEDYDPTFVTFDVDKNILDTHNTGTTAAGYLFGLYKVDSGVVATQPSYTMRTQGADGKTTFHIPLNHPTDETYILKEIHPADADKIPGMIYSTAEYTVNITAVANGRTLTSGITITDGSGQTVTTPVFVNEMQLTTTDLALSARKVLNSQSPHAFGPFTFELLETDGSFTQRKTGGASETMTIDANVTKSFSRLHYTQVGTHYYKITEQKGSNPGMTYDASEYHVTVNVTANGSALVANTSIVKLGVGTVGEIVFTNTYAVTGTTSVTIDGTKTLTGRPMLNGEFSFRLEEVADYQGTAIANPYTDTTENGPANSNNVASFRFKPITYTQPGAYYYKITENAGTAGNGVAYDTSAYVVKVTVSDNGQGGLTANWTLENASAFGFTNTYTPSATRATIMGGKDLVGRVLKDGEFTFELYETDSTFSTTGLTAKQEKHNNLTGVITFDTLTYSREGTYYYVVKEKAGNQGGITYDNTVYHVTINVVDDHQGSLVALTAIEEVLEDGTKFPVSSIVFYNKYDAADTYTEFTVKKTITGRADPSGFTFGLYRDLNDQPLQTVVSDDDGVVTFTKIPYTMDQLAEGPFTYYIKEINDSQRGITYDATVYTVVVTLTDDEEGSLVATYTVNGADVDENTYQFAFENVFTPADTHVMLNIEKVMKTLSGDPQSPEGYKFKIADATGKELAVVTSDAKGNVAYGVTIKAADVGKTLSFIISEVNTKKTGVTYSSAKYAVEITVAQNADGELVPTVKLDGTTVDAVKVTFINTYEKAETPETGDSFSLTLWAGLMVVSMLGMVTTVVLKKKVIAE